MAITCTHSDRFFVLSHLLSCFPRVLGWPHCEFSISISCWRLELLLSQWHTFLSTVQRCLCTTTIFSLNRPSVRHHHGLGQISHGSPWKILLGLPCVKLRTSQMPAATPNWRVKAPKYATTMTLVYCVSILDFIVARMMEVMVTTGAISCKDSVRSSLTATQITPNFLQAGCTSCRPNNSVRTLNGKVWHCWPHGHPDLLPLHAYGYFREGWRVYKPIISSMTPVPWSKPEGRRGDWLTDNK